MPRYRVPTASLTAVINPLEGDTWKVEPIDPAEVREAASRGEVVEVPWRKAQEAGLPADLHRIFHIRRIAYLLGVEPQKDDEHKMFLAVSLTRVWFYDGNHRAAAAIVRGDPFVELYIADSKEQDLASLFPGLEPLD